MSQNNNDDDVLKQGWVLKKSKHLKTYHRRFMQLKDDKLLCYKTDKLTTAEKPTEIFDLSLGRYSLNTHDTVKDKFYLINESNSTSRTFKAESESQRNDWIDQIRNSNNKKREQSSLLSMDSNSYIFNSLNNGKLLSPKPDCNQAFKQTFEKYGTSISCCVMPKSRAIPYHNFESTHMAYFQYKQHELKKTQKQTFFDSNDYQTQTRFAYCLLHIGYSQLLAIEKFIKQSRKNKFFAEPYPEALADTKKARGDLESQYVYEEWLMTKPILPAGPGKSLFGKKKSMTAKDVGDYSNYLHKILNSAQLMLTDEIYQILNFDEDVVTLFKTLALKKLETLEVAANKYDHVRCLRDPSKLKNKIGINFHTLWVVKRPLNDTNAAFLGCNHWALKFEGNDHLMTIGFFSYNEKHGIILTKLVPNTPINRRLFWYYWPSQVESEHFNCRWTVLEKLYLAKISCELIGILTEHYLHYDNNAVYDLSTNNCQDFCCAFLAPLDINIAKRLSSATDTKKAKSFIPGGMLVHGITAEANCNNMRKRLWPIISQYNAQQKAKRQREPITEQQTLQNNFDFIAAQFEKANSVLTAISSNTKADISVQEQKSTTPIPPIPPILIENESVEVDNACIDVNINGSECYDKAAESIMVNSAVLLSDLRLRRFDSNYDFDQSEATGSVGSAESSPFSVLSDENDTAIKMEHQRTAVIANSIRLTEEIINIANSWHSTYTQDIISAYPLRNEQKRPEISTPTDSSGDSKKENDEDSNNGDNFRNNNNNDNDNNNDANNNDDNKNGCKFNGFACDVPWHATRLKELEDENERLKEQRNKSAPMDEKYDSCVSNKCDIVSCDVAITIQPSKKLTKCILGCIEERFSNMFVYMSQYSLIHAKDAIAEYKYNESTIKVVDYNVHCKQTQKRLYGICEKSVESENANCIVWKTNDCLYTQTQIKEKYGISANNLPKISMDAICLSKIENMKKVTKEIENILRDENQRRKIFNIHKKNKIKWNNRDKIPIFNKISKATKCAISLELTKEEFLYRLGKYANDNVDNIHLLPIIKFDKDGPGYYFEVVWIVNIGININVNIAISLKVIKNTKAATITPCGIYLDVYDQHKLVPYQHNCKCLERSECAIDILQIGSNKESRAGQSKMQQKLNESQQQCNEYKAKLLQCEEDRQKDNIMIKHLTAKSTNLQEFLHNLLEEQGQVNQLNELIISDRLQQHHSAMQTCIQQLLQRRDQ